MKALKLKDSQLEQIYFNESERFEVINKDEWTQAGKYQYCNFRFKDKNTNLIYEGSVTRNGSPSSDWHYTSDISCDDKYIFNPVEEVEIKNIIFKEVSNDRITETEDVKNI